MKLLLNSFETILLILFAILSLNCSGGSTGTNNPNYFVSIENVPSQVNSPPFNIVVKAAAGTSPSFAVYVKINGLYSEECLAKFVQFQYGTSSSTNTYVIDNLWNRCFFPGYYKVTAGILNGFGDTTWAADKEFHLGTDYTSSCVTGQPNRTYEVEYHPMAGYSFTNSPKISNLYSAYNLAAMTVIFTHYPEPYSDLTCDGTLENAILVMKNYFLAERVTLNGFIAGINRNQNYPNIIAYGATLLTNDQVNYNCPAFVFVGKGRSVPLIGEDIIVASAIHELAHQLAIRGHGAGDHTGCCVVSEPWPLPGGVCNYSSYLFCDFHKCLIYNSRF